MARNIEIKARVTNPEALRKRAAALSGTPPKIILQEDTFFYSPRGRLKLRVIPSEPAQLICYDRPDRNGPKLSDYYVYETSNPEGLKAALTITLGIRGLVRKERHLYRIGQTRIHLDYVTWLGHFVELEVVLSTDQSEAEGEKIVQDLMVKLNIQEQDLIEGAYIDLLESGAGNIPTQDS